MALEKQVVPIPFTGGLETKTDPKLVQNGKLTVLENGVFTKAGTILKRNGYDSLTTNIYGGGSITSANRIFTYQDEIILLTDDSAYSYSTNFNAWVKKGASYNVGVKTDVIVSANNEIGTSLGDIAINGNIKVIAWSDIVYLANTTFKTELRIAVEDAATGTQYLSNYLIKTLYPDTTHVFRVVSVGSKIFLIWLDNDSVANVKYISLDISTPTTLSTEATLLSDGVNAFGYQSFDVISDGTNGYLGAHVDSSNLVKVIKFNSSGSVTATYTTNVGLSISADFDSAISLARDSSNGNIYGYYNSLNATTGGIYYFVLNSALVQQLAPTRITTTAVEGRHLSSIVDSANHATLFFDTFVVQGSPFTAIKDFDTSLATMDNAGTSVVTNPLQKGLSLVSKPFIYNSNIYVMTKTNSTLQSTYFVLRSNGEVVAKSGLNNATPSIAGASEMITSAVQVSTGKFQIINNIRIKLSNAVGGQSDVGSIASYIFDFNTRSAQKSRSLNEVQIITGGYLSMYDGQIVTEYGFHLFPENAQYSISDGGSVAAGTYLYYFTYEWTDGQGNTHRSAPSEPVTVVVPADGKFVGWEIPSLKITTKNDAKVVVYRTKAGQTIPFRLPQRLSEQGVNHNPRLNDKTQDVVQFQDNNVDTDIENQEILYTTGGVLENIAPPANAQIEVYKNRLILSGLEDNKTLWYSKQIFRGEGTGFTDAFFIAVDSLGSGITATKTMDDKLIIFKDNLIFVMAGDGPTDFGQDDNFTMPQLISTDVGCPYPDSILLFPNGIIFQSYKGFYLLDRALRVTYIGAPVEAYNSQVTTNARLLQDKNQIRFLTSSGSSLVYDYFFDQWGSFTNHLGKDSVVWNNLYTYLRTNGAVYKENTSSFLDVASAIVLKIVTAWIKFSGLEGYQRVRRFAVLGNKYSDHTLTVGISYDYNDTIVNSYTFNTATAMITDPVYQFRGHLAVQKCEALKFTFDDSVVVTPGQGYSLNDLTVEVGIKRGIVKLPSVKSV